MLNEKKTADIERDRDNLDLGYETLYFYTFSKCFYTFSNQRFSSYVQFPSKPVLFNIPWVFQIISGKHYNNLMGKEKKNKKCF